MNTSVVRILAFALLTLLMSGSVLASPASDEKAIREVAASWEADWNAHDMTAMGKLITEDADFVNVAGLHWKGRTQIVEEHAERHRTNLKLSHWTTENVRVQQLSPKFALVHVNWLVSGDTDFDGTPRDPRHGIFSWLVVKVGNQWLIRSVQNTNITPRK